MDRNADRCPSLNTLSNRRTTPHWLPRSVPMDWCWALPLSAAVAYAPTHAAPARCSPCSGSDDPLTPPVARVSWALPQRLLGFPLQYPLLHLLTNSLRMFMRSTRLFL